jgi:phage antirepressor YoqD-like protein
MAAPTKREPLAFLPVAPDGAPHTMSSVEIADLTGKRHDHVIRDIRKMLADLGNPSPHFWGKVPSKGGRPMEVANLPRRECLILVSGYSVDLRARIIDRWEELERVSSQPPVDLNNPATLRLLLADYANDKIALEEQVAELAPKAEALDRIATADGSLCVTDAAKALQMRPKDLFSYLREHGWIYRRAGAGHDVGYQSKTTSGLLEHKVTTVLRADGSEKVTEQVRITPKGLAKLSSLIPPPFNLAA